MIALRLEPPIEMDTPKGRGFAIIWRDYGYDTHDLWTVALKDTGDLWTFMNNEVHVTANRTFGTHGRAIESPAINCAWETK